MTKIGFRGSHPFSSFLFFLLMFVASLSFSHPLLLFSSFFCAIIYDVKLHGKKALKSIGFFILPMLVLITASNFLFSHYGVTTLFEAESGNLFTLEALSYGFVFAIKTACIFLWLSSFNEVITSDKFIFLFGRFSPRIALVISMVLRFIPLFSFQSSEIETARKGLGIDSKSGNLTARIRNSAHSLSILITWILESAIDTSDSMTARGYGLKTRRNYNKFVFAKSDFMITGLVGISAALLIIFRKSFYASFNPIILITPFSIRGMLSFLIFTAVGLMPFIFDLWEEKLWSI